ncbi:MAG: phosphate ABC transporter substrate-binding protein [Blastocatellia bacterium]
MRNARSIARLLICLGLLSACAHRAPQPRGRTAGQTGNSVTIKGSDTMVLLGQWWAENYQQVNPQLIVQVNGGGSGTGIAALLNGTTDITQSSRPIRDAERARFREKFNRELIELKVALDGLGIYVHESNPLNELTIAQVREIYAGRMTDWRQTGGASGKIILYSRENNSGAYEFFKDQVLAKEDFAVRTQTLSGNAAVVNAVSKDANGIGYGGIAFAKGVKILAIKRDSDSPPIPPLFEHVTSGAYPISRFLYWYLPGEPAGEVKKLVDWVRSQSGQNALKEIGFFPIKPHEQTATGK